MKEALLKETELIPACVTEVPPRLAYSAIIIVINEQNARQTRLELYRRVGCLKFVSAGLGHLKGRRQKEGAAS